MTMERNENRKYYHAYDERYKIAHMHGVSWSSNISTPIVLEVLKKYGVDSDKRLLEIGCGEGRDARAVLNSGFNLMATDASYEAIAYCKSSMPKHKNNFRILDCLSDDPDIKFDFIYSVAVIHMLVLDTDRSMFYQFIRDHLSENGIALICTMGDGTFRIKSDISTAFEIQERDHQSGKMFVPATSCRIVSFDEFESEITESGLTIIEKGIAESLPDFNSLMYVVVKR